MSAPLGYARDGDVVTLRMTPDDHDLLLLCIGYAAGGGGELGYIALALANRLQEGVPLDQWTPYDVPEDAPR
jgi:hypothetical protein